jgi:prevent-host-death family protein
MISVGAFEAKTHLSSLLDRVERGEDVIITRHGKAVARLVPAGSGQRAEAKAAVERIRAGAAELAETLREPMTIEDIIGWKNEGRR